MSTTTTVKNSAKVITGKVRFCFVHVFEPYAGDDDGKEKYSVCILIDENDKSTLDAVNAAIEHAKQEGKAKKFEGKIPSSLKSPLANGEDKADERPEYVGKFYLNARSEDKPGIVDINRRPITDKEGFYSGCYGRASITFYAYNWNGKKGIGVALNNVQKLEEGERLAGMRTSAEDDFATGDEDDIL
jgi:hypothetical protein